MAAVITGLVWLLACQLAGEVLVRLSGLPVPGPVVGMVLLFALLQWRAPDEDAGLLRVSDTLLRHLQLFFVPAGVGVVVYLGALRTEALPLGVSLVASWGLGLVTVGWLTVLLARRAG